MRSLHAALLCAIVCLFSTPNVQADSPQTLRNAFVIEFNDAPTQRHLMRRRQHLYRRLRNENLTHVVRHEFKYINAISIEVDKPSDALDYLKTLHDVKRIWPIVSVCSASDVTVSSAYSNDHRISEPHIKAGDGNKDWW